MMQSVIRDPFVRWWWRLWAKRQQIANQPPIAKPIPKPRFNPMVPRHVAEQIEAACISKKWMVAVWRVENDKILLDRTATNFPQSDVDQAMRMIVEDVQQLKVK